MNNDKSRNKKQKTDHSQTKTDHIKTKTDHIKTKTVNESAEKNELAALLYPHTIVDFFENYWEKKPLVIQASEPNIEMDLKSIYGFSKEILEHLASKEKFMYVKDVHACKCIDGKTEDLNKKGRITAKEFLRLFKTGATVQFHQPQRFIAQLWKLLEKLESYFGCLVGSNVYITPKGTQGLAPHYDDVEVFIVQLEGEKHWRLYEAPVQHALEYKTNLPASIIGLPTHEFTLKPGDVLYMPRGTIHQAETPKEYSGHSTHITISTYQRHCFSEYLLNIFPQLIQNITEKSAALRKGLPLNFLGRRKSEKALVLDLLKKLGEGIVTDEDIPPPNNLIEDFMTNRLPPYEFDKSILEETPDGENPTIDSSIRLAYPGHITFCLSQVPPGIFDEEDKYEDEGSDNEDQSDKQSLLVYTTFYNDQSSHMIESDKEAMIEPQGILKFPISFIKSFEQLRNAGSSWTPVKEMQFKSDVEKIQLATALWTLHIVQTK